MLFLLGGAERTEREWDRLLRGSLFAVKNIVRTGERYVLIEASPFRWLPGGAIP